MTDAQSDITGRRFGRWTVIKRSEKNKWLCRCDCGVERSVYEYNLKKGKSLSCGCLRKDLKRHVDISGMTFGRWTVLEYVSGGKWLCRCECGTEKEVSAHTLVKGKSLSCGCTQHSLVIERFTKHGGSKDRLYTVWANMKARCCNPHHPSYDRYGGRGIKVCDEWLNDYVAFLEWAMAAGYDKDALKGKCTIDRIDNDGDYCPENCRWTDVSTQNTNKRPYRNSGKWRAVELIDEDGNVIQWFPSLRDASDATGCKDYEIVHVCSGKHKHTHGKRWRYADANSIA